MKLSNNSLTVIALANEFCQAMETADSTPRTDFVVRMVRLLPRIYITVTDIAAGDDFDPEEGADSDDFGFDSVHLDENHYNEVREQVAAVMGADDTYLETFHQEMKYSDTPIAATVSESLADIFQVLYNFVEDVRDAEPEEILGHLHTLHSDFVQYWSETLCNVMRPLNQAAHHLDENDTDDEYSFD